MPHLPTTPNPAPPGLTLRLFGSLEVRVDGEPVTGLHLREGERLLAYLALHAGEAVTYRALAELFWPAEARLNTGGAGDFPSTRQAVHSLRRALGDQAARLASPGKGAVRLDLDGADVDTAAFDRLALDPEPASWREALGWYGAPLLEGWTEPWAVEARRLRRREYERLLRRLADDARERGDGREVEAYLRRLATSATADEEAARSLIRLLGGQGRFAEAREVYEALAEELTRARREPQPETEALIHEVRRSAETALLDAGRGAIASGGSSAAGSEGVAGGGAVAAGLRSDRKTVVLLYKREAEPDERLVLLLEKSLRGADYPVFIDRHLVTGVEWAREIERQLRNAYAVVPLLSPASMVSEMLQYEVEKAHEAAQIQGGLPRLLPVRVAYEGPLPERSTLAAILEPLQYVLWSGPGDDDAVAEGLLRALEAAQRPVESVRLEPTGGAVALASPFYIVRPADEEFHAAVERRDSIVLVKGARQIGKTSLLARGLERARQAGARVVMTDLQMLTQSQLASPDRLFQAFAAAIALQLDLDYSPRQDWDEEFDANMNLELFLQRKVLRDADAVVWGLDEVDRLFSCSFGSDVFGLIRSWHNRRALSPGSPWSKLTLGIAYATEAHLFITDVNQSPFNVGTRVALEDFDPSQVAELNRRYGAPLASDAEIRRFHALFAGQPYLVRRGLDELVGRGRSLEALEEQGNRDEGPFGDHLRRLLAALSTDPEMLAAMRSLLRGEPCPTAEAFYRLRSAGLISGDSLEEARPRCRLYQDYLVRHLRDS